jgi:serine/threonine-protein kinase
MATEPQENSPRRYHCIGKYQVLAHVAAGGMGVVYKAVDQETGQEVALKILSPTLAARPSAVERFRREARHGTKLRHDNIVAVYDYGEVNGTWFLAQEFVQGIDLQAYIQRKGKLEPDEAVPLLIQAARGLDWLHQNQIVHRDIKPSNFLITEVFGRKVLKLTDLGVARETADDECRITQAGSTVGTIDYMAPEQARDSGLADIRSDMYSLGCTLYHMLAGHPPFPDGSLSERLFQHLEAEPPDIRQFNPKVSLALLTVLRRMLAKNPDDRYQTPGDLIRDLTRLTGAATPEPAVTPPPTAAESAATRISKPDTDDETEESPAAPARKPDPDKARVPALSPEQRRVAIRQYERAIQVMEKGNLDYGSHLLLSCCKLDPANLVYRQTLRRFIQAAPPDQGGRGLLSWAKQLLRKMKLWAAQLSGNYLKVLEHGEEVLLANPADRTTPMGMAAAADALGLLNLAIWLLEQIWQKDANTPTLNRALALLYEKRGNYMQASILWELVLQAQPQNPEPQQKLKELAAQDTIARGRYQTAARSRH